MKELGAIRAELDQVDRELTALLERRMELALEVARCKAAQGMPVLDAVREAQVLESRAAMLHDARWEPQTRALFTCLMTLSRQAQTQWMEEAAHD